MMVSMLKSKIHRATVTEANLNYTGSLSLDPALIEAAGLLVHEKILVVNINNGSRLETYIIEGERGSGVVCLNGAAARHGHAGDLVIIMSFASMSQEEAQAFKPKTVYVDGANKISHVEFSAA